MSAKNYTSYIFWVKQKSILPIISTLPSSTLTPIIFYPFVCPFIQSSSQFVYEKDTQKKTPGNFNTLFQNWYICSTLSLFVFIQGRELITVFTFSCVIICGTCTGRTRSIPISLPIKLVCILLLCPITKICFEVTDSWNLVHFFVNKILISLLFWNN